MKSVLAVMAFLVLAGPARSQAAPDWSVVNVAAIEDDDIARHRADANHLAGLSVTERRFAERGFNWHLLRFVNSAKPQGPLWVVPHDDENAAFEGAIAALKSYGGTLLVVNSGPGSLRRQTGDGTCGVKAAKVRTCDPNRNFDAASPVFTKAFLDERQPGQPIIALHTNGPGVEGDFSVLDLDAYRRGRISARDGGHFAVNPTPDMANYDTLILTAFLGRSGKPDRKATTCRKAINAAGIHFWHERVDRSDGSLSNYLVLNRPDIVYFNAESREESDVSVSAARHAVMIKAYFDRCISSK